MLGLQLKGSSPRWVSSNMKSIRSLRRAFFCSLAILCAAACGRQSKEPAPRQAPPSVTVLRLQTSPVQLSDELPGRVTALRTADIRPQVGGIVQRRLFEQGAEVKAGQTLFQLSPATFQADADAAAAVVQRAETALTRARQRAQRLQPLAEAHAVSRESYDEALAQRDQAGAEVEHAHATLARRRLDLEFATVKAPISGRIDQALVSEGALVGQSDPAPMARIHQIDQVYVDVRQPASMLGAMAAAAKAVDGKEAAEAAVAILTTDGKPYPVTGQILFSGISVDAGTGDALVRVLVDNPKRQLLPGMFVRARVARRSQPDGLLIPQQAVLRNSAGQAQAWVLDAHNKASLSQIEVGDVIEHQYVIQKGLNAGDTVVVEGQERLQEGAAVSPQPWKAAHASAVSQASVYPMPCLLRPFRRPQQPYPLRISADPGLTRVSSCPSSSSTAPSLRGW